MNKQRLMFVLAAAITVCIPSYASDPVGIYGNITNVVVSKKTGTVQIYGSFYTSGPSDSYQGPKKGYLLFNTTAWKLNAKGKWVVDEEKTNLIANQIKDLTEAAGSGKCLAFGERNYRGAKQIEGMPDLEVFNKLSENPQAVDFPVGAGVTVVPKNMNKCGKPKQAEAADGQGAPDKNPNH